MMSNKTIVITKLKNKDTWFTLYYYNGNFYYPMELEREVKFRVNNLIKIWIKNNKKLYKQDRLHENYKTKAQWADLQAEKA